MTQTHIIECRDLIEMLQRYPENAKVRIEFTRDMEKMERLIEEMGDDLKKYDPSKCAVADFNAQEFYDAMKGFHEDFPEPIEISVGVVDSISLDNTGRGGIKINCCHED